MEANGLLKKFRNTRPTGENGIISVNLARNLSAYKEIDLFSGLREKEIIKLRDNRKELLVNSEGKKTSLSRLENRILHSLGLPLKSILKEEDVKLYIKKLMLAVNDPRRQTRYPNTKVTRFINISDLCRLLYGTAKMKEINSIIETIKTLADKQQKVTYYGDNGTTVTTVNHFIQVSGKMEIDKKGRSPEVLLEITYGHVFFINILSRYAILPYKLFSIWGKRGTGTTTELFDTLLDLLLSQFWLRITQYRNARRNAYHRHKENRVTKEELTAEVKRDELKALTYEESLDKILLRVSTDYTSTRKMKKQLTDDLEGAFKALKEIGLITEATIMKGVNPKLSFVINPDYCKEDVKEIELTAEPTTAEES